MKTPTEIKEECLKKAADLKCEKEITALHHVFMLTRHKSQSQGKHLFTFKYYFLNAYAVFLQVNRTKIFYPETGCPPLSH